VGDVAVDTAELAHARARLEDLAADLEAVAARMAAAEGMALGARRLLEELERAQADWGTHVTALRDLADVAARDLGSAAAAYEACEEQAVARTRVLGPRAVVLGLPELGVLGVPGLVPVDPAEPEPAGEAG